MIQLPFDEDSDETNSGAIDGSTGPPAGSLPPDPELERRLAAFERVYRAEFGTVTGFFARRTRDPQLVADLTADTFVAAMRSFGGLRSSPQSERAWVLGVARRVWARHLERPPRAEPRGRRRASIGRLLSAEEIEELMWRIDLESKSAELLERLTALAESDRDALELVDIVGLTAAETARELGLPVGLLHVRLRLARARLRRGGESS